MIGSNLGAVNHLKKSFLMLDPDCRPVMRRRAHSRLDRVRPAVHLWIQRVRPAWTRPQHERPQTELRQVPQAGQGGQGGVRKSSHGRGHGVGQNVRFRIEHRGPAWDRKASRVGEQTGRDRRRSRRTGCPTRGRISAYDGAREIRVFVRLG